MGGKNQKHVTFLLASVFLPLFACDTQAVETWTPRDHNGSALPTDRVTQPPVREEAKDPLSNAKLLFEVRCAVCHGSDGNGDGPAAAMATANLRSNAIQSLTDEALMRSIAYGKNQMPSFNNQLTTSQTQDLVRLIRSWK